MGKDHEGVGNIPPQSFREAVEAAGHSIYFTDEDGNIEYVNPAFEEITGYSAEEAVGENPRILKSGEHDRQFYEALWETITSGETWRNELINERKSGEQYVVDQTIAPVTDETGAITNFVAINVDITDQKERQRRYDAVFNQTYQFTGLLEPDGTLVEANETALEFGGLEREDVIGKKMWEAYWFQHSEETRQRAKHAVERAAAGEFVRHELPVQGADREVIIDFSVRPLTDEQGNITLLVPEGRDITDLKERERALQRERDRLDEFANLVSHDLRNPLQVASGRLELAQQECDSEHHEAIQTSLDRTNRIIENVLWLAREGRDIGDVDAVPLQDLIDSAWTLVAESADQTELRYEDDLQSLPTIEADRDRFYQLLENLFRNAIEHGGDDVTVTVGVLDDGFYVEDDGDGIPEGRRDDVFTAGYSTDEEGTGFGLSIVKQVAEGHGWSVRVTEGSKGGARFEITGIHLLDE